jgi:hypothetical protein
VAEQCRNCRLWRPLTDALGECHARAPAPLSYDTRAGLAAPSSDGLRVAWPLTEAQAFCGDWRPLPVRQQEGGQTS